MSDTPTTPTRPGGPVTGSGSLPLDDSLPYAVPPVGDDLPHADAPERPDIPDTPVARSARRCPVCGTPSDADSSFCEACGSDLAPFPGGDTSPASSPAPDGGGPGLAAATPQTAPPGEESPLDVGWTGPVPTASARSDDPAAGPLADEHPPCASCGAGRIVDGYCDQCGTPPPDPRDHFTRVASSWVAGVCDIGKRHSRNEDALAISATAPADSRAVLVVCDGVSMATDSHIASLAAAEAALAVLDQPFPKGVGTPEAWSAGAARALTTAVTRANLAVAEAVVDEVPNPPSCTIAIAVVEDGVVVAGNVGDSRIYWLPDAEQEPPRQLGLDDSWAQEQISAGHTREEAETGPHAHAITRWLGRDAPEDLTPHLTTLVASAGWLMACTDGLWNYVSEAADLRALLHETAAAAGSEDPAVIAQGLVDHANAQGGRDNITVALARLAGRGSTASSGTAVTAVSEEGGPADG
ncbi:MAG: protein phosphatase 2C domain-containing protein [Terracoccus sp.]